MSTTVNHKSAKELAIHALSHSMYAMKNTVLTKKQLKDSLEKWYPMWEFDMNEIDELHDKITLYFGSEVVELTFEYVKTGTENMIKYVLKNIY